MRVFIVDDSKPLRDRLIEMMAEHPRIKVVGQADNPRLAIQQIPITKAEAVILDIRMPGGNGIGLLKEIKKHYPSVLVIMYTNYPLDQYRKRCMALGADLFFEKSTQFEKLMNVLTGFVQDSRP